MDSFDILNLDKLANSSNNYNINQNNKKCKKPKIFFNNKKKQRLIYCIFNFLNIDDIYYIEYVNKLIFELINKRYNTKLLRKRIKEIVKNALDTVNYSIYDLSDILRSNDFNIYCRNLIFEECYKYIEINYIIDLIVNKLYKKKIIKNTESIIETKKNFSNLNTNYYRPLDLYIDTFKEENFKIILDLIENVLLHHKEFFNVLQINFFEKLEISESHNKLIDTLFKNIKKGNVSINEINITNKYFDDKNNKSFYNYFLLSDKYYNLSNNNSIYSLNSISLENCSFESMFNIENCLFLTYLHFENCNLDNELYNILFEKLKQTTRLKTLNIINSNFNNNCLFMLSKYVKNYKCCLESLDISSCNITGYGFIYLNDMLLNNTSIQNLIMNNAILDIDSKIFFLKNFIKNIVHYQVKAISLKSNIFNFETKNIIDNIIKDFENNKDICKLYY